MKKFTNDNRVKITKFMIRKAFTELLEKKPIQSISVKELCELAGINRGTFYSHYTDMYDLLEKIEAEMLSDFLKAMEPLLNVNDRKINPVEISTGIFQCLKDNSDLCIVTLGDYGDKDFLLKLINIGRDRCLEAYSKYFENVSVSKIEYYYAFVSEGCIGILRKWLAEGMILSSSEIARMAENMMLGAVSFLKE